MNKEKDKLSSTELRLMAGEAYVMCSDCGCRLHSISAEQTDGRDVYIKCPYDKEDC